MGKVLVAYFSAEGHTAKVAGKLAELQPSAPGTAFAEAKVLSGLVTDKKIHSLIEQIESML